MPVRLSSDWHLHFTDSAGLGYQTLERADLGKMDKRYRPAGSGQVRPATIPSRERLVWYVATRKLCLILHNRSSGVDRNPSHPLQIRSEGPGGPLLQIVLSSPSDPWVFLILWPAPFG